MKYRVLLVEGNRLMMEQLANVINQTPDFELAAKYQSDSDALGQGGVFKPNPQCAGDSGGFPPRLS